VASTRTEDGINDILEQVRSLKTFFSSTKLRVEILQYKTKSDDLEYAQMSRDLFAKPILGHLYRGYTLLGVDEPKQETEVPTINFFLTKPNQTYCSTIKVPNVPFGSFTPEWVPSGTECWGT